MIQILFLSLMALSCLTAAILGGRDGRRTAFVYVLAVAATHVVQQYDFRWSSTQTSVLAVDSALLVALCLIAIDSRRYWPIWLAGFHILTVASHFAAWLAPPHRFQIYFLMESFWAIPKLVVLTIGVLLDWEADRERRPSKPRPDRP